VTVLDPGPSPPVGAASPVAAEVFLVWLNGEVLEHGLCHLAWLAVDDPAICAQLATPWFRALEAYAPQPFRNFA